MSIPILNLVSDAAIAIGDPNKQRVQNAQWLSFYNRSARELCQKANVLAYEAEFSLTVSAEYGYPPEMTVFTGVEATLTPTDDDSWAFLKELFEDEWRSLTSGGYPTADLPTHYFAKANFFYLYPRPLAALTDGGLMHYFGLPDAVTDISTGVMQTDAFTQDYLIRRMIIHGMTARNRLVEAKAELDLWNADVETLQDKIDDRSLDRRSGLRQTSNRYKGMR